MARRLRRPDPAPDYAVDAEGGQGSRLADVELGDYSYCDRYCDLANTTVGKFSNIASFAGVSARVIRFRQPPEIVERLERLAWWDWDHATLRERLDDFRTLNAVDLLDRYEQGPSTPPLDSSALCGHRPD
ncbi:hypothetical protein [Streptomyces asiaticus]|uniref:hypothetical protein n=1 Tax=Streptomyces asiaticus TaxID=114695 RepID=UPI003D7424E0